MNIIKAQRTPQGGYIAYTNYVNSSRGATRYKLVFTRDLVGAKLEVSTAHGLRGVPETTLHRGTYEPPNRTSLQLESEPLYPIALYFLVCDYEVQLKAYFNTGAIPYLDQIIQSNKATL